MTAPGGRFSRRAMLGLALASMAGTCAGDDDVPAVLTPMPAGSTTPLESVTIRTVAQWAAVFQQSWDYQHRTGLPMSRSTDSWDHYDLSYSVDSCIAMFRATGERRYLDRALEFTLNVADSAAPSTSLPRSSFRDKYHGWSSAQENDEVPLYESYFWRYGTALLVAMRDNGTVLKDPRYRDRFERLLAFSEINVFEKWFLRGRDNIFRERTHMASHWALIATNLAEVTADSSRRARYHEVAASIDVRLRGQLRRNPVEPHAYFWNDRWGSAKRPGQDVSHGNGVMAYVAEARTLGTVWTATDMAAFSALLTTVIWPAGRTYRGFVDGSGSDNGWFSDGFVKLGRFDPAVQARLDGHQVVNDQFAGNMALNAKILRKRGS